MCNIFVSRPDGRLGSPRYGAESVGLLHVGAVQNVHRNTIFVGLEALLLKT